MSYLWSEGAPIRVEADRLGAPERFRWRERWHGVERVLDRWRVDRGWWNGHAWREYFKAITDSGMMIIVYHELSNGGWRLQELYD